jgi:hypothetical protein
VTFARLVVVTDGYENRPPRLPAALAAYAARTGVRPAVCLVQPPDGGRQLAVDLRRALQPFDVFAVDPHGVALDALVPALAAARSEDLLETIADYPLDGRR